MASWDDVIASWRLLLGHFQGNIPYRRGLIGDGNGTVHVANKVGWDWIRYNDDLSKLSQVRNPILYQLADDTPVIVGKLHPSEEHERVLYVDLTMYGDSLDDLDLVLYGVGPHGINHHALIGSDPAWIDTANLVPGRVRPTDPVGMSVYVEAFYYPSVDELLWWPGGAIDLTAHVPAAGHCYVLVYMDIDDHILASFAGPSVPLATAPDYPAMPESCVPLGIVDLEAGQTEIQDRYWQYKILWGTLGGDVSIHTHSGDTEGGASIVGLEEFMYACHEPLYLVGNAIWPFNAYHSLYLTGEYIIGLDAHADLVWIHPDPVWGCGQHLTIRPASPTMYASYSITVRHGVGNIWLSDGGDRTLDNPHEHLHLIYDGEYWCDDTAGCCGGGGGGAPTDAQYVVMVADAALTHERVLTGTANEIVVTDGGAGGNVTLSAGTLIVQTDQANTYSAGPQTWQDAVKIVLGTGGDGEIYSSGDDLYIRNVTSDKDIIFQVNDGGAQVEVARFDGSTGRYHITAHAAAILPFLVQAAASQSEDLTQWRNSGGTILSAVNETAQFTVGHSNAAAANMDVRRGTPTQILADGGEAVRGHSQSTTTNNFRGNVFTGEITNGSASANIQAGCNLFLIINGAGNLTNTSIGAVANRCLVRVQNNSPTISLAVGQSCIVQIDQAYTATITKACDFRAEGIDAEDGTITNAYGFYGCTHIVDAGTLTNAYGLYLEDQDQAATLNYAIYTNAGMVRFGDDVERHGYLADIPDEITATDAGVAASLSTVNTEVTTNGDADLDNVTLANGTSGQVKRIYCVVQGNAGDTWKITPANMVGGAQITFAGGVIGEGCILVYADNEGWCVVANNGGVIT